MIECPVCRSLRFADNPRAPGCAICDRGGPTADFIEYLALALLGQAASGWPPDLQVIHQNDLAAMADREFALLERIDPDREWLALVHRTERTHGVPIIELVIHDDLIENVEAYLERLDRVAYGFDTEWC